ncbi:hypothetical protein SAMN04488020_105232 [Palleronia marisminoris]|uniref:Uncharacterized protein n=1 Tax=Palleronia marisminoris TaxID=315423 RepID=A0A1Y5SWM3_9RHOB|nr:hypothetical protein [Palleronia marisminoris]SFG98839.1 hypothetical protein SAMN04488020_105232 [Palleronia marisminoris]SLN48235.1 hypothetical protein PAM7066_02176 [Palleronia marisminoris]
MTAKYDDVAFFVPEEKAKFEAFARGRSITELGKLVLSVRNAERLGAAAEPMAAAYLITNLLLMSRAQRRIAKLVILDMAGTARSELFPLTNALRYFLMEDYTQLDNFDAWVTSLKDVAKVSPRLRDELSDLSDFMNSSELGDAGLGQRKAETMLAVRSPEFTEDQGLTADVGNPFMVRFSAAGEESLDVLGQSIHGEAFSLRVANSRDVIVIEIDGAQAETAISQWIKRLDDVLDNALLGLNSA